MPIAERRLRLSRHVHAPYTAKGIGRCTSTDTPRAVYSESYSVWPDAIHLAVHPACFFSNLSHWSSVYHSLLLGGPLQNRHKHCSCDRTHGKQESFSSESPAKHLAIWRDNARKNFCIAEGMSVSSWYPSVWANDGRSPKYALLAQTSSAACLNGAAFGSLFLKEVSGLTSAVSGYSKTDFFFFLLWEKHTGLYTRKIPEKLRIS